MQYGRIQGGYPGFNFYLPEKKKIIILQYVFCLWAHCNYYAHKQDEKVLYNCYKRRSSKTKNLVTLCILNFFIIFHTVCYKCNINIISFFRDILYLKNSNHVREIDKLINYE